MGFYLENKGLGVQGHVEKDDWERIISDDKVRKILKAVETAKEENPTWWWRDYGLIYLGYFLGLRIGEACILERRHFSNLEEHDRAKIPTLKKAERITFSCRFCSKQTRISSRRIGHLFECRKCGKNSLVRAENSKTGSAPEYPSPFMEPQVKRFILRYIEHMRPDQQYLFESRNGRHVSKGYVARIFSTYTFRAKLSPKISWHSLRHGRGAKLYSLFKDLKAVMDGLRHASVKSAQVYAHFDDERRKEIERKLGKQAFDGPEFDNGKNGKK